MKSERRSLPGRLGAHPERRVLAPARRAALRGAAGSRRPIGDSSRAAVVVPPVVNMYAAPSAAAAVVSQATLGSRVSLLRKHSGWALAETADRYRGWIRSGALRPDRRDHPLVEVASLFANLYMERDVTTRAPIAVLPMLARLELLAGREHRRKSGRVSAGPVEASPGVWLLLRLPDGRIGWGQRGDFRPAGPPWPAGTSARGRSLGRQTAVAGGPAATVTTALRFLGLPYLWGGTTPFGVDCSGLVQLVHQVHGRILPRDADLQWADRRLAPISRRRLRAGDLVFFGPRRDSITHVGIAAGRSAFINATTRGGPLVRIDRLDDPYWKRMFRGARRPG